MQQPFINPADWSAAREDVYSLNPVCVCAWAHMVYCACFAIYTLSVCARVWTVCEALAPQKLQPLHLCVSICVIGVPWEKSCIHLLWQARPSSNPRVSPLSRFALTLAYVDVHAGGRHVTCRSIKSLPACSAGAGSTGNHRQGSIISYWTISALVLSAFLLWSSEATSPRFYPLRSKVKLIFPEMRKLDVRNSAQVCCCWCLFVSRSTLALTQISTLELTVNLLLTFPWCNLKPLFRQLRDLCGLSWIVLTAIVWNST